MSVFSSPYEESYPPSIYPVVAPGSVGAGGQTVEHELPGDVEHFTVTEIKTWVDEHNDQADEVLAAEQARGDDARVTLVTWLEGFVAGEEEPP